MRSMKGMRAGGIGFHGVILFILFTAQSASALPPAVGEWNSTKEDVVPLVLEADSRNVGQWTRRVYTRRGGAKSAVCFVEVNLMEGPGPRWHGAGCAAEKMAPPAPPPALGHPARRPEISGESSEYEVTELEGHYAVLERHPLLPLSLAVAARPDATLTLEGHVDEGTLKELAGALIQKLDEVPNP